MKKSFVILAGLSAVMLAQRIRTVFGILEGNPPTYASTGLYYRQESGTPPGYMVSSLFGTLFGVEPFGTDLAYDPKTKLLFVIGGGPNAFTWNGSVHALDVWRSIVPLPVRLSNIGARRLAVKDTLLLVTRNKPPYFTAYRIRYNAAQNILSLDSLWSPSHFLLRNVPDGILVWGDTAFIAVSYHPTSYSPDSIVLAINLRTRQVVGSWQVYPNPLELVRIKDSVYVACYGNFTSNLRIARIFPSSSSVVIRDAGYVSYGGFATDTSGSKDTILFWSLDGALRAFDVRSGQTSSTPYFGLASSGPSLNPTAILWAGSHLHMGFTNYTDTSLIVLRDPIYNPAPPHLDSVFGVPGRRGIGYPGIRRFIYVEDDTSRGISTFYSHAQASGSQLWYNAVSNTLYWEAQAPEATLIVCNALGQVIFRNKGVRGQISLEGVAGGVYIGILVEPEGKQRILRFYKP
ncbi:MAG: hypothetical protein N2253_06920 [Bacteroidia bacterium]|nr:hypothetical protein [Bacteroidia bacterium]